MSENTFNIDLNFIDRNLILQLLPKKSDFKTLIIVRDLSNKLKINQDEIEKVFCDDNPGLVNIEEANKIVNNYQLTILEKDILKEEFNKIDKEKRLPIELIDFMKKLKNL